MFLICKECSETKTELCKDSNTIYSSRLGCLFLQTVAELTITVWVQAATTVASSHTHLRYYENLWVVDPGGGCRGVIWMPP